MSRHHQTQNHHQASRQRKRLYVRDGGVCWICGHGVPFQQASRDHMVPASRGQDHRDDNMRMACVRCNQARGDSPLSAAQLEAHRRYIDRLHAERVVDSDGVLVVDPRGVSVARMCEKLSEALLRAAGSSDPREGTRTAQRRTQSRTGTS